jgi:hypothetical protein
MMISGHLILPPSMMKMINKKILTGLILFVALITSVIIFNYRSKGFSVNLFSNGSGWGYDIVYNKKLIIHQPYMPAMAGQSPFESKDMARATGRLVINKLRTRQSPRISSEEIKTIMEGNK